MPILSLSAGEAASNLRASRASRWPDGRASGARLEEEARVRLDYGVALLRSGATKEGNAQLEIAQRINPDHPRTVYKLGLGLAREKHHAEALAQFRQARELDPVEAAYAWRLGAQLVRMRRTAEGLAEVQAALSIDPRHDPALEFLQLHAEAAPPDAPVMTRGAATEAAPVRARRAKSKGSAAGGMTA